MARSHRDDTSPSTLIAACLVACVAWPAGALAAGDIALEIELALWAEPGLRGSVLRVSERQASGQRSGAMQVLVSGRVPDADAAATVRLVAATAGSARTRAVRTFDLVIDPKLPPWHAAPEGTDVIDAVREAITTDPGTAPHAAALDGARMEHDSLVVAAASAQRSWPKEAAVARRFARLVLAQPGVAALRIERTDAARSRIGRLPARTVVPPGRERATVVLPSDGRQLRAVPSPREPFSAPPNRRLELVVNPVETPRPTATVDEPETPAGRRVAAQTRRTPPDTSAQEPVPPVRVQPAEVANPVESTPTPPPEEPGTDAAPAKTLPATAEAVAQRPTEVERILATLLATTLATSVSGKTKFDVEVLRGVARIKGTVETLEAARQVRKLALDADGISEVEGELDVIVTAGTFDLSEPPREQAADK